MKFCPNCGKALSLDAVRCSCGTYVSENPQSAQKTSTSSAETKKSGVRMGKYQLTIWDIAFIFICNISFTVIIVDAITGNSVWSPYVVLTLLTVYFLAFACAAGSMRKLFSRYRNAVLFLNLVSGIFGLIVKDMRWANDYFIPCNTILAGTAFLLMLFHKDISARHVFLATILLLLESTAQFVLYLFGVIGQTDISKIFVILAFCLNLMTLGNIAFLYFTKLRYHAENSRWWR